MIRAENLQINHLIAPMGIQTENPRFTWTSSGAKKQTAYRILIRKGDEVVYDTGKLCSRDNFHCANFPTLSRTRYHWSVTLWDESDCEGESSSTWFETGIENSEWQAQWIDPEGKINPKERQNASYLKKTFRIADVGIARLYITAHGIYDAYINGQHVDGYLLAPGNSQYDKRLQVQGYDVSALLQHGENELLVTLGDGWYRGSCHHGMQTNCFGTDVALLCQLENDSKVIVCTDDSWLASQNGPLGKNDFMMGEEYDARKETISDWHPVQLRSFGYDNLIGTNTVPVKSQERFSANLITTPAGEKVLDFGQNLAGYVEFELSAKAGQTLILTHGEVLDENGNFTIANFQNPQKPNCHQKVTYICKDGKNTYHPTKCYFGFRYVKVEGDVDITGSEFQSVAIYSDMRWTGRFSCGDPLVNQLFHNAVWSMKSNFVDVPTDCPTREKSGYSGDLVTFCHTAMYLADCYAVLDKWISEQAATQRKDGGIRQIAPYSGAASLWDNGAGWCDSLEIVPWRMMNRYQDVSIGKKHYEEINKWMKFCLRRAKKTRIHNLKLPKQIREHMVDTGIHWGEWLEPDIDGIQAVKNIILNGEPEVATAYLALGCQAMADMASRLGKADDAAFYQEKARLARKSYRYLFVKNGQVLPSSRQCRYVRPLSMGLLEESEKQAAVEALKENIKRNGNHLNTGFLTTHELCRGLTDGGAADTAYDMLLQQEPPCWLYPVIMGETTIPESWQAISPEGKKSNSFNHYSYGSIVGWLFDRVCGICVEQGRIVIRPYPDRRLGYAAAEYDSPLGAIRSAWEYRDDTLVIEITIPCNSKATVLLPDGRTSVVEAGYHSFVCHC